VTATLAILAAAGEGAALRLERALNVNSLRSGWSARGTVKALRLDLSARSMKALR
jgi:hypothetical protein